MVESSENFIISGNLGLGAFLNRYTGYLVDWNRVGELLRSGSHNYSWSEIMVRCSIVIGTLIGTNLGVRLSGSNSIGSYLIFFCSSATISHSVAIYYLIMKRWKLKQEIQCIINQIRENIKENTQNGIDIESQIDKIMKLEAKNNASSSTLGLRKRMLLELLEG